MSARFTVNFVVLLLGAGLVVATFAFSPAVFDWVGPAAGGAAVVIALSSFALPHQGAFQRVADILICVLGAWAIVAGRVLTYNGRWLEFGVGAGLAGLGAAGLVVRERHLSSGLRVGDSRIGPEQLARLSALQHDAGVKQ